MNAENISVEAVCFAAPDGGEKAEPSVSPDQLIARLAAEASRLCGSNVTSDTFIGEGIFRAIKIIQREFSDELAR